MALIDLALPYIDSTITYKKIINCIQNSIDILSSRGARLILSCILISFDWVFFLCHEVAGVSY